MERNELTTLGAMKEGDRFYFPTDKKKTVYQIQETDIHFKFYNRINAWGYKMLPHDLKGRNETQAIYLRHKTDK